MNVITVRAFIFYSFVFLLLASFFLLIIVIPLYISERNNSSSYKKKTLKQKESKITKLLDELAASKNRARIPDIINQLRYENEQIVNSLESDKIVRNKAQNILTWLTHFSIDRHLEDLMMGDQSSQIFYDEETKNYQLMIPGHD
ncbi:MAG: hypothetical protein ACRCS8_03595 [Brevinema sp.]